ncbi:E3 ubiquitin-protein ligase COP1 [Platanthera zijinensis]|uniref:E3 ubiquitin-protein ligase COP1 n=1 Tax=Platanthera zijinensis TaxID=2320716 RepID=A0AAP0BB41_9ASPA
MPIDGRPYAVDMLPAVFNNTQKSLVSFRQDGSDKLKPLRSPAPTLLNPSRSPNKTFLEDRKRKHGERHQSTFAMHKSGEKDCDVSVKELDKLLSLLTEKKRKMEQHKAETNMEILLDFLHYLRKQNKDELNEVQTDLQYIKEDVLAVEKHTVELYRARERYSVKLHMLLDDPVASKMLPSTANQHNNVSVSSACIPLEGDYSELVQGKEVDMKSHRSNSIHPRKDAFSGSDTQPSTTQTRLNVTRKQRIHSQVILHHIYCV